MTIDPNKFAEFVLSTTFTELLDVLRSFENARKSYVRLRKSVKDGDITGALKHYERLQKRLALVLAEMEDVKASLPA